jgi:hypothetical protein
VRRRALGAPPPGKGKKHRLEAIIRASSGDSILDQAKAAATAKMIGKLLRKHPLIAAELALTGISRGAAVGISETKDSLFGGSDNKKEAG